MDLITNSLESPPDVTPVYVPPGMNAGTVADSLELEDTLKILTLAK